MRCLLLSAFCLLFSALAFAQPRPPEFEWIRFYGDTINGYPQQMRETGVTGDVFPNGDFVIASQVIRAEPRYQGTIVRRTDQNGNLLWERSLPFNHYYVQVSPNGDVLCAGDSLIADFPLFAPHVARLDGGGSLVWSRSYQFGDMDPVWHIDATDDGGCVGVGKWLDGDIVHHPTGFYVLRLDAQGDTLWTRRIHRAVDSHEVCQVSGARVVHVPEGGFLIAQTGACDSTPAPYGVYLTRLAENGEDLWTRYIQPPSAPELRAFLPQILPLPDNGFLLVGGREIDPMNWCGWIFRVDRNGMMLWDSTYVLYPDGSYDPYLFAGVLANTGGVIISGIAEEDSHRYFESFLFKLDLDGNILWRASAGLPVWQEHQYDLPTGRPYRLPNGGYIMASNADFDNGWGLAALLRFSPPMMADEERWRDQSPDNHVLSSVAPNPFNSTATLTLTIDHVEPVRITIHDLLGREVETLIDEILPAGEHRLTWAPDQAASGIYFARILAGESEAIERLLLLR